MQIVRHIGARSSWLLFDARKYVTEPHRRCTLSRMRLASKAFCRLASPLLFQHIVATCSRYHTQCPLDNLHELCSSKYTSHVRHLELGIESESACHDPQTYIENLAKSLCFFLSKLPKLYSLNFEYVPDRLSPSDLAPARALFARSIAFALRSVNLPNLHELKICLPNTHAYRRFFPIRGRQSDIPIESICRRLRYLHLTISENISDAGRRYRKTPLIGNAPESNKEFEENMFQLLGAAENLASLCIQCSIPPDFGHVSFPRTLRNVILCSLILISDKMSVIFSSSDVIRSVYLSQVELTTGTWRDTLMNLAQYRPKALLQFVMRSCGYAYYGRSANLRDESPSESNDRIPIKTNSSSDMPALHCLRKIVGRNRAACGLPADCEYETADSF